MYVETKTLPDSVQAALRAAGYHRADIEVEVKAELYARGAYGTGYRAYFALVNLATGETQVELGAWGGANPFSALPLDRPEPQRLTLVPGFAVLTGSVGHKALLDLVLHPDNAARWLPAPAEITPRDKWILGCFAGLTSAGRKNEFERRGKHAPQEAEIAGLVSRGYLSRNKAGATAITTKGRNAAGDAGRRQNFVPQTQGGLP